MGTNFYWIKDCDQMESDSIRFHIGKRSAAGTYCWDCGTTFCLDGSRFVHKSRKDHYGTEVRWAEVCPSCLSGSMENDIPGATAVELGFKRAREASADRRKRPTGVSSCSSFVWTLMRHKWDLEALLDDPTKVVVNEYGDRFTAREFLEEELFMVALEFQNPSEFF